MMVPEPTEAMMDAAALQLSGHEGNLRFVLEAAFAAAPPEWLLRAALTDKTYDEAQKALAQLDGYKAIPAESFPGHKGIACANLEGYLGIILSRAFRGGEET